jgi:hypothetical protein
MNKQCKAVGVDAADVEVHLVRRVLIFSGLLTVVLAVGGWYISGWCFSRSVLIGGMLVNASFWLLKTDIKQLMERVGNEEESQRTAFTLERTRFFLKFYARLVVLGLLLIVLASQAAIDVIGLTLGLTTVMFSVVIIGLSTGRCWTPSKV